MVERSDNNDFLLNLEKPYKLIDSATGDISQVAGDIEKQQQISQNTYLPTEVRLEAYEDIIDSEVGN
jgi:threonine synthase